MIYVDTNVILDILQGDSEWLAWSIDALKGARADDNLVTGYVVAAEIGHYAASVDTLSKDMAALMIDVVEMDMATAFRAGTAYREYRRRGGKRPSLLPDFVIGAHASALGASMLTRDTHRFRSYFPELTLITPETHP